MGALQALLDQADRKTRTYPEVILGALALGAAVLIVSLVVWLNLGAVERAVAKDEQAREILSQADAALEAVLNQETGVRGYVITANPEFLEPYEAGGHELSQALDRLADLTEDDPAQQARVMQVAQATSTWRTTIAEREIAIVQAGGNAQAKAMVDTKAGLRQMGVIRGQLAEIRRHDLALFEARSVVRRGAFTTARWMLVVGGLGALALAGLVGGWGFWLLIRSRAAAQEAVAFMRAIIEAMPAMLVVKNAVDHRFELVNRAGEALLGATREEIVGKTIFDTSPPEEAARFAASDREALNAPDGVTIEDQPLITRHGLRYLNIRKIAVEAPDGSKHLLAISTDVTHLKAAAKALEEALDQARAAERAKTEFLANMSHEIRTPLNGVAGVAEALDRTDLDDSQRRLVDVIRRSAAAVDSQLTDILALSREAGEADVRCDPFALDELADTLVAGFQADAATKGLSLSQDAATIDGRRVIGDVARLRLILSNLLSNAVKFTDAGEVSFSVSPCGPDRYRFTVTDTGIGFDLARRTELFAAFGQADASATRRYGGAGLGLAIAQQTATVLGAALDCVSEPGRGSIFTLEVDLPSAEPVSAAEVQPAIVTDIDADDEAPLRVLIVDDHPTNRQVLELILSQLGAEWVSVENGAEAVEAAAETAFDAILMDIQMPVMDGITATREIRRRESAERRAPTPIIIVSANCQAEHVQAGRDAGAQSHLAKPVAAAALIGELTNVLAEAA